MARNRYYHKAPQPNRLHYYPSDDHPDDFGCVYCDKPIKPGDDYLETLLFGVFCSDRHLQDFVYYVNYQWNVIDAQGREMIATKPIHLTREQLSLVRNVLYHDFLDDDEQEIAELVVYKINNILGRLIEYS